MTPEVLEHAFEPFFTTKDVGQGSGLGLSMVFGFARQSGGDVSVHSVQGSGTTLALYLPRTTPLEITGERSVAENEPLARGETILVVEDNAALMEICVSFLQDLGYGVLTAVNGHAASAILAGRPHIDAVLCDVVLPGKMSGQALARAFMRRYSAGKVLYISGYAPDSVELPAADQKNGLLLTKPFTRGQLAQRLREVLDASGAERSRVA